MKKIVIYYSVLIGIVAISCNKYLDINTNQNSATSSSPDLVFPLAIVNTASLVSDLNDYGSRTVGYSANAGGYGGFGSTWTYDYSNSDGESNGQWDFAYQILENFQYVINQTQNNDEYIYYNASAKIMKAFITQMLIDEYNDIPYSEALTGDTILTPKFDSATAIYPELTVLLDSAINEINNASSPQSLTSGTDPLFGGKMVNWKKFANTVKLRLFVRDSAYTVSHKPVFSSDGFLADDAVVNPGYQLATGQTNPSWGEWVVSYTGSNGLRDYIPSYYIYGFYDGHKLKDSARGAAVYYNFPSTPLNQMGIAASSVPNAPSTAGAWYSGSGSGTSLGTAIGVMKGPDMGEPLMLLAESDFLQAEADVRGILSQTAETDFNNGITASFTYLYKTPANEVQSGKNPTADAAAYIAENSDSYLANYDEADTKEKKIEAIITQKYIALNFIHGQEAWSEYRRTGYPRTSTTVTNNAYNSFASTQSQATRPDHLPTRLPYPTSEISYNGSNVPSNINPYTSLIFWARNN